MEQRALILGENGRYFDAISACGFAVHSTNSFSDACAFAELFTYSAIFLNNRSNSDAFALKQKSKAPMFFIDGMNICTPVPDVVPQCLIIDDDLPTLEYFTRCLSTEFHVSPHADPLIAMAEWRVSQHDLVLTDMRMPGTDGRMIAREIKLNHPKQLLACASAYFTEQAEILLFELGATIIHKPVHMRELRKLAGLWRKNLPGRLLNNAVRDLRLA